MRCPSCNKFVSQEAGDPEVEVSVVLGVVSGTARIVQTCAECSEELKEANFDIEEETKAFCDNPHHTHDVEVEDVEATDRSEGKGRYTKTFYGFSAAAKVTCEECKTETVVELKDEIAASSMDELA